MEFQLKITQTYLGIPVQTADRAEQELHELCLFCEGNQIMEFNIPAFRQREMAYDYLAYINVKSYVGKELRLSGEFLPAFFAAVTQSEETKQVPLLRPELHFTAERGWINDPNGLVYQNGTYHLYYQYNPMNTEWENMSWGHGTSRDLIHWTQEEPSMYPDEYGTIYSGSGIVNERQLLGLPKTALLFFYTAAAGYNRWSKDKKFIQRLAYSLDGGKTLIKHPDWELAHIAAENRDPKVFWHQESLAYIMVLYVDGNDFAVFRSEDLKNWEQTQELKLKDAWECPDLMELEADDGTRHWIFWSADGFYFLGDFDGRCFTVEDENGKSGETEDEKQESKKHKAYGTKLPYAAQTYSGIAGRTVSVAWLRTEHKGQLYTGAMAIPRELSLVKKTMGYRLRMVPVRELESVWQPLVTMTASKMTASAISYDAAEQTSECIECKHEGRPSRIEITWLTGKPGRCTLNIGEECWQIDRKAGTIGHGSEVYTVPDGEMLSDLQVITDRGMIEITANHDIIYLVYETTDYQLDGSICYEGDRADVQIASAAPHKIR